MLKKIKEPILYYNRYTQALEEEAIYGEKWLRWAYESRIGRPTTKLVLKRAWFSAWYGWRMDSFSSKKKILPFIEKYSLDTKEFQDSPTHYRCFNDFFCRKLKKDARPIDLSNNTVVFPADGRHLGFQDSSKISNIFVKGQKFDLKSFLNNEKLAKRYQGGALLISRLCPTDYHRFHFPISGVPTNPHYIQGDLLSVNPIALRKHIQIFWQNRRMYTEIQTPSKAKVLMAEIGATCVGHIHQTFKPQHTVRKGTEKGFFKFGGSSTILLFEPGFIQLCQDLQTQSSLGYELFAKMGDVLGHTR